MPPGKPWIERPVPSVPEAALAAEPTEAKPAGSPRKAVTEPLGARNGDATASQSVPSAWCASIVFPKVAPAAGTSSYSVVSSTQVPRMRL